jgi:hypothetical protein
LARCQRLNRIANGLIWWSGPGSDHQAGAGGGAVLRAARVFDGDGVARAVDRAQEHPQPIGCRCTGSEVPCDTGSPFQITTGCLNWLATMDGDLGCTRVSSFGISLDAGLRRATAAAFFATFGTL